jgi:uncharacterized protein with FMN-binding domain
MRRAVPTLAITAAAVVLLARYETTPPRTVNPNAAHQLPRAIAQRPRPAPTPLPPGTRSALGPAMSTPFSLIQVRAFVTHGRLTGVETVALSGDGPHTEALNARAEPILRAEALKAHSADIHVVSGATSTSKIWIASLRGAIRQARRGD